MKPSILIVMLDFLVCSLLMFVIGTGGEHTQFATSSPPKPGVNAAFSAAALQAQQEEWNRDYDQQAMLTQLNSETAENQQLRSQLTETSATLAAREANLKAVSEEKTRVEQAKAQTEQSLSTVETQLNHVTAERQKLEQEGNAAKQSLAKAVTEMTALQAQQAKLQQERADLSQQAQQLGQTVASQQATISALSEGVRSSQERAEAQLNDIAQGQQQMGTTLDQLNQFTRTLPATLQKTVTSVNDQQQAMQQNMAELADDVKQLQGGLGSDENAKLLQAVADMAKGQQGLQSRLDALIKAGQNDQFGQSLNTIEAGQEALRKQTAQLGEQIESIKARGPGPFRAVKGARIELAVALAVRDRTDGTTSHFKSTTYPPVVQVDGRSLVIASAQTLGFAWWPFGPNYNRQTDLLNFQYTVSRSGETSGPSSLASSACALRADPHVVAVELDHPLAGLNTMELAPPEAAFQTDQHKLYIFKTTAAGLSFEAETTPNLGDARYLVVKRNLRGVAAWFENPAYRPEVGDYMVTDNGKFVGIMVTREKCLLLNKENLASCALTIPLDDKQQFAHAVPQLSRLK